MVAKSRSTAATRAPEPPTARNNKSGPKPNWFPELTLNSQKCFPPILLFQTVTWTVVQIWLLRYTKRSNRGEKRLFFIAISKSATQRPRKAYFINRHTTFCKELSFNFPEHQKILKSIKNPMRKSKKSEICLKFSGFFKKSENFENIFENFPLEIVLKIKIPDFRKFWIFWKMSKFSKIFHIFSIFSSDFFWISKFFDVLESWSSALSNKYYVYLWNMLP